MNPPTVRVAYVTMSLAIGGAETQLVRLVNGLDRRRFRPSVVCLVAGGELEAALRNDAAVSKPGGKGGRARAVAFLAGEIRRQKPDIVHAYLPAAYVPSSLAAWSLHVPLIIAARRGFTSSGVYHTAWWRALTRLANRIIDVQICNSEAVRDAAVTQESVRRERTRVIHNGIDLPSLNVSPLPPELVSADTQAVMVANFIPYKGHRVVLRAVARVVERHPRFRLVLVGDGHSRPEIEQLAADLGLKGSIVFAGGRRDGADLVRGFDFSVLGSSEESFPNALLESMASAIPVVSTRVGGVSELVEDRKHGLLVPFGDVDAMAEAIAWMIEHPAERRMMGQAGRERVAVEFTTERMVGQTEKVYEELLALRSSR